jgi:DNA replication protein DnaC
MSELITVPFNPDRSPRSQIEAAIASLPPRPCERHPHELRPVASEATLARTLLDYPKPQFTAIYERCVQCPLSQAGRGKDTKGCPVASASSAHDEHYRLWPTASRSLDLETDRSAREVFNTWLQGSPALWCGQARAFLPLSKAGLPSEFEPLLVRPQFAKCPQCALEGLDITPDDAFHSFANFEADPPELAQYLAKCREFAANPHGVLLMLGNCGTGKTHLAIAILRELLRLGARSLVFITHRKFVDDFRLSVRPVAFRQEPPEDPLIRCRETSLLVYDDLTPLTDQRDSEGVLLDLLEYRINHYKPTVITANITRADLEAAIGSRLFDRFRRATFAVLEFDFPSRRSKSNADYLQRCQPHV